MYLLKTYLLANKIYCMYIPTAFSLLTQGGTSHKKLQRFYCMTFNAVNHVNILSNNKWLAHASLSHCLLFFGFCTGLRYFIGSKSNLKRKLNPLLISFLFVLLVQKLCMFFFFCCSNCIKAHMETFSH